MFIDICLHTDPIEGMFPEESKPGLHGLRISILDLDQTTERDSFKILLALLVHKVASWDGPAFDETRQWHGTGNGQVEIISGTDGEVGKELDILDAVGSQLEITHGEAVLCLPPEWS